MNLFAQNNTPQNNNNNNMFNNNNNAMFNNNNNNMFNNNNNNNNMFNNNNGNNNMFNNNNNMFNNGNNNSNPMFNNNNNNNQLNNGGNTGTNLFNNGNNNNSNMFNNQKNLFSGGSTPVFGNNQPSNNQFPSQTNANMTNMFSNNTNNGMFSNNNSFNNNTSANNQNNPLLTRPNTSNIPNFQNASGKMTLKNFQDQIKDTKYKLQVITQRMSVRNLQSIRLDSYNQFIDKPLNKLPFKQQTIYIMKYFAQLNKLVISMKKSSQQINAKMKSFTKDTRNKLNLYKKCLLQTVSHNKLIQQVSSQISLMDKQLQDYFKPLYNAYKNKKRISIKQPNQFDLKMSYQVLNKLQILNQRVDDIIACQNPPSEEQVENTITVFEQLIQYYQNVTCHFNQFCQRYNKLKRQAIESTTNGKYEAVMSKVTSKVQQNLKSEFQYYNLIKEINDLLAEKDKRESKSEQLKSVQNFNFRRRI